MIFRNISVHYSSTSEDEAEAAWKAKKEKLSLEDKGGKSSKRFTFFAVGDSGGASEQMDFDFSPLVHSGFVFWNEWMNLSLVPKIVKPRWTQWTLSKDQSEVEEALG